MRLLSFRIISLLASASALSKTPCQHAFILYNDDKGIEVTRFSDSKYPPQFSVDSSKLSGISRLRLVASLCNNVPPYQSAELFVSNLTGINAIRGPTVVRTVVEGSQALAVNGNFFKIPGVYTIDASSYSQAGERGFPADVLSQQGTPLDTLQVVVQEYRSCQRGFTLYNTDNQTPIARFPDVGTHYQFPTSIPEISSTQGIIDLLALGNTGLNLVAEFCNARVKNVTFRYDDGGLSFLSVSSYPSFSLGPKSGSKLLPAPFLKTPNLIHTNFEPTPVTAVAQNGIDSMNIYLSIIPSYQIVSYALVNANTGKDLATSIVTKKQWNSRSSSLQWDLAAYPANATFSIRANTLGTVNSGNFQLGSTSLFTANQAPFAIAGLASVGRYKPLTILSTPGSFVVYGTPFTGLSKSGAQGPTHTLSISILARVRVSSLTWIDATRNSAINVYTNGPSKYEVDPLQHQGNTTFGIRANPGGKVGSMEFRLSRINNQGQLQLVLTNVANGPPYCLGGTNGAKCSAVPVLRNPGNNNYKLLVTAYSESNKRGAARTTSYSINTLHDFRIMKLTMVDASTGKDLFDFFPFEHLVDLSTFPANTKFAIRAYTAGKVGSIAFSLQKYVSVRAGIVLTHVENGPPFYAAGTSNTTGKLLAIPYLSSPGSYGLSAVPYSMKNKGGIIGIGIELQIDVVV